MPGVTAYEPPRASVAIPPPEPEKPALFRWAVWVILLALILVYFQALGGDGFQIYDGERLERTGQLLPDMWEHDDPQGWRLIHGSFVHSQVYVLMITGFLVWLLGGELERRAGAGLILLVFVGLGALLNALRVEVESYESLLHLAGGWPSGLALAGAAWTMARRLNQPVGRVVSLIVLELALLAYLAFSLDLLDDGLVMVAAASLLGGAVLGAVWPLHEEFRPAAGCLVIVMVFFAVMSAEATRERKGFQEWVQSLGDQTTGDPNPEPPAPPAEVTLSRVEIQPLHLALQVPDGWSERPQARTRSCPECEERISFPARPHEELAKQTEPETQPCTSPDCRTTMVERYGADAEVPVQVQAPRLRQIAFAEEPTLASSRHLEVHLFVSRRSPFDDTDTLAVKIMPMFAQSWLTQREPLGEGDVSGVMGKGYRWGMRGRARGRGMVIWIYVFLDAKRTVILRFMGLEATDPKVREADSDLFERIATSVEALEAK